MNHKLPASWRYVPLGKCCNVVSGATPRRNIPEYWDNHIPWVTPKDISNLDGPVLEDTPEYISRAGYESCSARILPKGSVLFSSRAPIGLVAIAGRDMCTNQGFKSLVPNERVDSGYLFHCMKWMAPKIAAMGNGATFKEVSKEIVNRVEIPLPPLLEQKRIAAILDKAAAIRRKRQYAIKLADDFLRATFLDMFGDPVMNPKRWKIKKLGKLAHIQIGPFGTQLHKEDYISNGIPLINPSHILSGKIIPNFDLTVSQAKYGILGNYHLQHGDIIMGRRGEMGRCAIVTENGDGWLCGTGSLFIRFDRDKLLPEYLFYLLSGKSTKSFLENESIGATLPNLNKTIVGKIDIPIPDIETQITFKRITEKFNEFSKNTINSFGKTNMFLSAITQRAFRGEL